MTRVGYYLAVARDGLGGGGTGPYSTRILENLLAAETGVEFHLFVDKLQQPYAVELQRRYPRQRLSWSVVQTSESLIRLLRPVEELAIIRQQALARQLALLTNHLEWQTRSYKVDLIHCPLQTLRNVFWRTPTIITMHDVQELHFPEFFTPYERAGRARLHWWSMERATKIVVSFAHVKDDIVRYFRIPPEKIAVCPIPITATWFPATHPSATVQQRYNLPDCFLLYPAQTWPHKNHIGLLRALAYLGETYQLRPALVLTGKANEHAHAIRQEAERLGVSGQVHLLGIVPAEDLAGLYQACRSVVVPTLYEAGSFPVIEAILLGAPVVCSRVTSLPETIGDRAFTFDPADTQEMAEVIYRMLVDDDYRLRNRQNAELRRQEFSKTPQQSAAAFHNLYHELAGA